MNHQLIPNTNVKNSTPIFLINSSEFPNWLTAQSKTWQQWLNFQITKPQPGTVIILPNQDGGLGGILGIINKDEQDLSILATIRTKCPDGTTYHLEGSKELQANFALAWGMDAYKFNRLQNKKTTSEPATLATTSNILKSCTPTLESIYLIRDLINLPTNHFNTNEMATTATNLAKEFDAKIKIISGDDLIKNNYPAVHAVGRASTSPPKFIDITWGSSKNPSIVLIGKGVCFDSGGLNIKTGGHMYGMKKDMGGAAHALGIGRWIMATSQPVHLRILIPTVENAIAGNAFRPGDVIQTRKGLTVEVGNTDAEGRLILADALAAACENNPDLIMDFSTLTGAQRIAMGTEIPSFFSNSPTYGSQLKQASMNAQDIMWEMPLYQRYKSFLKSQVADLNNISSTPYGGSITAALFLEHFVEPHIPWIHVDFMAANAKSSPGFPEGGEAMGLRAVAELITKFIVK